MSRAYLLPTSNSIRRRSPPVIRGGQNTPMMEVDEPVKIGPVEDFETLRALVRKYITERGGEIMQWRDMEPR